MPIAVHNLNGVKLKRVKFLKTHQTKASAPIPIAVHNINGVKLKSVKVSQRYKTYDSLPQPLAAHNLNSVKLKRVKILVEPLDLLQQHLRRAQLRCNLV